MSRTKTLAGCAAVFAVAIPGGAIASPSPAQDGAAKYGSSGAVGPQVSNDGGGGQGGGDQGGGGQGGGDQGGGPRRHRARHVLLISVDGLHAFDLEKYTRENPHSNLAELSRRGTTYGQALSSFPSDSFPGMLALATGGTPRSTGVYYDNSYDRSLYGPSDTTCQGTPDAHGVRHPGTQVVYDETIDKALPPGQNTTGPQNIDPARLPRAKTAAGCNPVYPHQFLRVNTIFNVAHDAGLRTAWSDKHPAYDLLNGHQGGGIDDLFTPDINPPNGSPAFTASESATQGYDKTKVRAILNEIDGRRSDGTGSPGVPAIFGMNFQAVSVGQKLPSNPAENPKNPVTGGYTVDAHGDVSFTAQLRSALDFVDQSLGQMVGAMKPKLRRSTEIIITAKHGQSPIRPVIRRIGGSVLSNLITSSTGADPTKVQPSDPSAPFATAYEAQLTTDDVALAWLREDFQPKTGALVSALEASRTSAANPAAIDRVIAGPQLRDLFGNPATDPRVPDAVVQPQHGVVYSTSKKKVAEHGGGTLDDRNVGLLVVDPSQEGAGRVDEQVSTTQVAPTILDYLKLDSDQLQAAAQEHTQPLPEG